MHTLLGFTAMSQLVQGSSKVLVFGGADRMYGRFARGAFDGVLQKGGEDVEFECNGIGLTCRHCVRVLTLRRDVL